MVAPVVRPLGVSVVSASILVLIEQAFLGALPTLALAAILSALLFHSPQALGVVGKY